MFLELGDSGAVSNAEPGTPTRVEPHPTGSRHLIRVMTWPPDGGDAETYETMVVRSILDRSRLPSVDCRDT